METNLLGVIQRHVERQKTANRAYQFLGLVHFLLIGVGSAWKQIQDGVPVLTAAVSGLIIGVVFLALFLHLADYHGNAAGDGRLIEQ